MHTAAVQTLLKNSKEDFNIAANTLVRISGNILNNIDNERYRSVRIDSKAFQEKIMPVDGAVQCLFEMGFQEDGDRFTLFSGSNLDDLKAIREHLLQAIQSKNTVVTPQLEASQDEVFRRIVAHLQHSSIYENRSLQAKARMLVPLSTLNERASKRLARQTKNAREPPNLQHCLLLELLAWFKRDFFTWTDAPKCKSCPDGTQTISTGSLPPSQEDLLWGASRVEGYKCSKCGTVLRFPRYNHPEKLLETRTGRCGEWANCFTLICRSVGLEARHVLDWTDHVWNEVFISAWDRWVHCDPCENACDRPLMYEKGWKKKLSLIIAANVEQAIDVTWRYSDDRVSVTSRRDFMFDNDWLTAKLRQLNDARMSQLPAQRKIELQRRNLKEEAELAAEKGSDGEYGGRSSGSLAWRTARGETDGAEDGAIVQTSNDATHSGQSIVPTDVELAKGVVHLVYSSSTNTYTRASNGNETINDWDALVCRWKNVMHKEEFDWKKAYLCREEGCSEQGFMTWKVEMPPNRRITSVSVRVESETFDTGKVGWLLTSERRCDVITPGSDQSFDYDDKGAGIVSLHAFLSGGSGDVGWQKAQLFREATDDPSRTLSFCLKVRFGAA